MGARLRFFALLMLSLLFASPAPAGATYELAFLTLLIADKDPFNVCAAEPRTSTPQQSSRADQRDDVQLVQRGGCPAGFPVDCNNGKCCPSGSYCVGTSHCCRNDRSACRTGCCPGGSPHTCPQVNRCFATLADAQRGGCPMASIEVCGRPVR